MLFTWDFFWPPCVQAKALMAPLSKTEVFPCLVQTNTFLGAIHQWGVCVPLASMTNTAKWLVRRGGEQ